MDQLIASLVGQHTAKRPRKEVFKLNLSPIWQVSKLLVCIS